MYIRKKYIIMKILLLFVYFFTHTHITSHAYLAYLHIIFEIGYMHHAYYINHKRTRICNNSMYSLSYGLDVYSLVPNNNHITIYLCTLYFPYNFFRGLLSIPRTTTVYD